MPTKLTDEQVAEMLPCPFCGGPGKMIHPMGNWTKDGYGPNGSRITCASLNCTGLGQACYGPDQDAEAIVAWNTRAPSPELTDLRERLGSLSAETSSPPITRLLPDNGKPEWQQIDDLFARYGLAPPSTRLRDELVTHLVWARYGEELASMTNPETSSDLVKRLLGGPNDDALFIRRIRNEAATTIERLTARALAAEERLGRYEAALTWYANGDDQRYFIVNPNGERIISFAQLGEHARTALHSSEKANCDRRFAAEVTRTGQEILQKTVESLNEIGVNLMKVKQLEWEDDAQSSYAHSILGPYHIALLPTGWAWNIYRCAKREEAKAAAQRDFDARILSALHSSED